MSPSEITLWTAWSVARDADAFERLVRPALPSALAVALRLGCSSADADDAVQDALVRLASAPSTDPQECGVRAWLCREVRTRARSRLRSDRRRRKREKAGARAHAYVRASNLDVRDAVERALASLKHVDREAVELRYLHDMEYRDMAWVLGVSESACRQRVHRALTRLRGDLGTNATALVAALPLPLVPDAGVWIGSAVTGSLAPGSLIGGAAMAMGKKLAAVAAVAVTVGVGSTLGVQQLIASAEPARQTDVETLLLERDQEIARLRAQLDERTPALRGTETPAGDGPTATSPTPSAPRVDQAAVSKLAETWRKAIRQKTDPDYRAASWKEVRAALAGTDTTRLLAALSALRWTMREDLDRAGVRDRLLAYTKSEDTQTQAWAWLALVNLEHYAGTKAIDTDALRKAVADTSEMYRAILLVHLVQHEDTVVEGRTADLVLEMFKDAGATQEVVRGIGGATRMDARVLDRVLEYADTGPDALKHVARGVFPRLQDDRGEIRDFLLRKVDEGRARALEALRLRGAERPEIAEVIGTRLRAAFDASSDLNFRRDIVGTIGSVGDFTSREWLETLRDADPDPGLKFGAQVALRSLARIAKGTSNKRR